MLLLAGLLCVSAALAQQDVPSCLQAISSSTVYKAQARAGSSIWNASLVIPVTTFTPGWQMTLRFNKPLEVFINHLAGSSSVDNRQFVLRAPDDTLRAGSNLNLTFSAQFVETPGPLQLETVYFDGKLLCNSSNAAVSNDLLASVFGTPPSTLKIPLKYDYALVLQDSLLFYEAQRSGLLPPDNRISWRNDSCTNDRGSNGEDLTGGYYTNGRTMKFTFPNAAATTVLAWGIINHRDAYAAAGQLVLGQDALDWGAKYLERCHTQAEELYVLVGDVHREIETFWGRPEDINFPRPAYSINRNSPGSEVAAETAAALAASSVALEGYYLDAAGRTLTQKYLRHAKELYDFAMNFRGDYSKAVPQVSNFYKSWTGDEDELVWAALWLFRATGESRYKDEAQDMYRRFNLKDRTPRDFSWDDKTIGVRVLLSQMTLESEHEDDARRFCDDVINNRQIKTPKGLFHVGHEVGAIRYAANVAFICFELGEHLRTSGGTTSNPYLEFAIQQVNYILGDTGFSYMIGFGDNYPRKPHHSASSCPNMPSVCGWPQNTASSPSPQILVGAVVGGPDSSDRYTDSRNNYQQNDVGVDYNAGFQSLVAGLLALHEKQELPASAYRSSQQ